jgi:hypothetical protein
MCIIKETVTITNAGQNVREKGTPVGGKVNWSSHYGNQYGGSSKI